MIKILIADDEPLVQIGLRSMISWSSLGAEICGTASNGDAAWEMIRILSSRISRCLVPPDWSLEKDAWMN